MSHEGTPQEPLDRKTLLLEQFNEVDVAPAAAAAQLAADMQPVTQAATDRARDERGKFIVKEKPAEGTAPAAAVQEALPEPPQPWAIAPKSWKKELAQGWEKLDPAYQRYVHEREQQMRASYEAAAPKAELADKISRAAEPYMNTIRGLGLELPAAVEGLMKVDHQLRTLPHDQKLAVLSHVAMGYGIDLSGQMQTAQQAYSPHVQNIQNELLAIKGQFSAMTQQQEAAQQAAAVHEIQEFSKTAEHFEDVKPVMAQLLQSGMAEGIKDAYEKAIRLNPDLFDQISGARQAAADVEKRKVADLAAKAAKAAAVSVKSATPGTRTTNAQDRRAMLREQIDGIDARL